MAEQDIALSFIVAADNDNQQHVYDQNDHLIAETNTSGQTQREYIWLNDIPVAVVDQVNTSPVVYYVHTDHLGRPARMTAANWSWVWDVIYSPFGAVSYIYTNPEVMNAQFPGQWFQLETGLAYNWNRHYDPTLGRYIQPDPLGLQALLSDGPSAYNYARQSPLVNVDPWGTQGALPQIIQGIRACASNSACSAAAAAGAYSAVQAIGRTIVQTKNYCETPNSGDCDPGMKQYLQNQVNVACKPIPPRCQEGDSCISMQERIGQFDECAQARQRINNLCFRGGGFRTPNGLHFR